jgi:hypothetical protein
MSASDALGLFGCGLLGLAVAASSIRLRRLPVRARYAVMLAAALAVFVPWAGLSAAACLRGVSGDLSVTTLVLAAGACVAQLTGRTPIGQRDLRALCRLLALAAAFLYPFALGWTPFDSYAPGYGSIEFLTALLSIALAAWWARLYVIVLIVIAAALGYLAGAYESRNLWDYLIDPLALVYALVWLGAGLRRRRPGEVTEIARAA